MILSRVCETFSLYSSFCEATTELESPLWFFGTDPERVISLFPGRSGYFRLLTGRSGMVISPGPERLILRAGDVSEIHGPFRVCRPEICMRQPVTFTFCQNRHKLRGMSDFEHLKCVSTLFKACLFHLCYVMDVYLCCHRYHFA